MRVVDGTEMDWILMSGLDEWMSGIVDFDGDENFIWFARLAARPSSGDEVGFDSSDANTNPV